MATGFILTIFLFLLFAFMLLLVADEFNHVRSIDSVLNEHVNIDTIELATNSYMYDRNGSLISEIYREENRKYLSYEKIPKVVMDAFIATEDHRFFEHKGYDPTAIFRALLTNMKHHSIEEGASTVTQQLVRNIYLTHEQSYDRKLSEIIYAYQFEKQYSKEEIIELYLNTIFFHNGIYGIEAASHFYFSKHAADLTLAEVAFLSAIPNNPSYYNPLKNMDKTLLRKQWILEKMLEAQMISAEAFEQAKNEKIALQVSRKIDQFPDYVTYIHNEFTELVANQEGYLEELKNADRETEELIRQKLNERVQSLYKRGIRIETALDPAVQQKAVQAVDHHIGSGQIQGAAVVIDHIKNEIIAMTGGNGYQKFDFHRGFQAFRQPGSAIKPLLVYAPYLTEYDVSIHATVNADHYCKNNYCPKNFGGAQYGNVLLETAFKHSYNTPAVRILEQTGVETAFTYLEKLRFSQLQPEDYRLPSALGGFTVGMSPLEMTKAYTTFASNGNYVDSYGIRRVLDQEGNLLYEWTKERERIWSESANEKMKILLGKVVKEGTGRKANIRSDYIGGKTGTTNAYRDLWFIGIRNEYTAGVWVGKDQPDSLQSIYNRAPHLLIWLDLMK